MQTVVKNNCSKVFNILFINKAAVNLATKALVTCTKLACNRPRVESGHIQKIEGVLYLSFGQHFNEIFIEC